MSAGNNRFIGETVAMLAISEGSCPVRFRWRNEEHRIVEIRREWQDWGHSSGTFKKSWKNRRHRNYFDITTDRGFHGLLYFDRGVKPSSPRKWVILEQYDCH